MSSEWPMVKLGSLADFQEGYVNPSQREPAYFDGPVKWLRATDLNDSVVADTTRTLSDKGFKSAGKSALLFEPGTLAISKSGTIGRLGILGDYMCGNRAVINIKPKQNAVPRYIFFVLRHLRPTIETLAEGSVQKNLYVSTLSNLDVPAPPKEVQQAFAEILGSLDDRIILLRETNATLEAIAQALFKSWFVDFDPVRAKMEGRAPDGMDEATAELFPDALEETELGLVPRGWRVSSCQELFEVRDGTHESPKPSIEGYPLVTSKHITSGRVNLQDTYLISEADYAAISKRSKVNRLDVLITMIGTVGLSAILLDEKNDFAIKNIGLFKTSAAPQLAYFLSLLLKSPKMQEYLSARLAGTTQKYLSLTALREMRLLVPSEPILVEFSKITSTLFDGIHRNEQQAQTLATLRDTLLPRLISGQLRLPEAQAQLEDALV